MPGQPGSAASGSRLPAGVGPTLGAGDGTAVPSGLDVGPGGDTSGNDGAAVGTRVPGAPVPGVAVGATDALATATWLAPGATGSCRPPRAATKVMAIAAHATVKSADA